MGTEEGYWCCFADVTEVKLHHSVIQATIFDKTVEKIVYLGSIFLNIIAVLVLPSLPSPESNVVAYSKESLIPGRL